MFPIDEITKNSSKEVKAFIVILGIAWITFSIIQTRAQYKLNKVNEKLSRLQISKLESEGYKAQ